MPNLQRLSQDPAPKKIGARVGDDDQTTTCSIRRAKKPEKKKKRRRNNKLPTRTKAAGLVSNNLQLRGGERRWAAGRMVLWMDARFLHEALPERSWHEGAGTLYFRLHYASGCLIGDFCVDVWSIVLLLWSGSWHCAENARSKVVRSGEAWHSLLSFTDRFWRNWHITWCELGALTRLLECLVITTALPWDPQLALYGR